MPKRSCRVVHLADTHIGSSTNFGTYDGHAGMNTRVMEFLDTLDLVVDLIIEVEPNVVLFGGDAFRNNSPTPTLVDHFADRIKRMADVADVVMVVGNHDRHVSGTERRTPINGMRRIQADHPIHVIDCIESVELDSAYVIGIPWKDNADYGYVCDGLDDALSIVDDDKPVIALGHLGIEGAKTESGHAYKVAGDPAKDFCLPLELFSEPDLFHYVALGHIHKHQCLNDNPPVVYSGSIDRVNWGERHDPKGIVVADIGLEEVEWRFVDLMVRPMVHIEIPYKKMKTLVQWDVNDAIVRVVVKCNREMRVANVRQRVIDTLPGTYHRLDDVLVDVPRVERQTTYNGKHLGSMSPLELVGVYLDRTHADDPDWADVLYDAAADLIEEADE